MTPASASELRALADCCETASGADRALDCVIADAIAAWPAGWIKHLPGMDGAPHAYHNPEPMRAEWMEASAFTASLDAAMALVPEGWHIALYSPGQMGGDKWHVTLDPPSFDAADTSADAATPALALCAAALRACALAERLGGDPA